MQRDALEMNAGFFRVERLLGNIGYIDLRMFFPLEPRGREDGGGDESGERTRSLIIDLRQNGGGDPKTVALFVSYLMDSEPFLLNSFLGRDSQVLEEFWTTKKPAGRRYTGRDVYVFDEQPHVLGGGGICL